MELSPIFAMIRGKIPPVSYIGLNKLDYMIRPISQLYKSLGLSQANAVLGQLKLKKQN